MAVVADTISLTPTYQPYERPPDNYALWSAIPRGLRGGFVEAGSLSAKPVNDDQTFQFFLTLSPNYAYVFAEIGLRISQDRATDWDDQYTLNLQNWYQGKLATSISWSFALGRAGLGGGERTNGPNSKDMLPKQPFWAPSTTSGPLIVISAQNDNNTVAGVGTVAAYINFWEFDLEQARKFPINAPVPTHAR